MPYKNQFTTWGGGAAVIRLMRSSVTPINTDAQHYLKGFFFPDNSRFQAKKQLSPVTVPQNYWGPLCHHQNSLEDILLVTNWRGVLSMVLTGTWTEHPWTPTNAQIQSVKSLTLTHWSVKELSSSHYPPGSALCDKHLFSSTTW